MRRFIAAGFGRAPGYSLVRTRDVFADDLGRAKVMRRMALYVVAFISFWSVPMAHRICQGFDYNPDWLAYLDALCVSGQGFVNAFVRCRICLLVNARTSLPRAAGMAEQSVFLQPSEKGVMGCDCSCTRCSASLHATPLVHRRLVFFLTFAPVLFCEAKERRRG